MEGREERLAEDVVEANELKLRWKVGINSVFAKMLVMFDVVLLKAILAQVSSSVGAGVGRLDTLMNRRVDRNFSTYDGEKGDII